MRNCCCGTCAANCKGTGALPDNLWLTITGTGAGQSAFNPWNYYLGAVSPVTGFYAPGKFKLVKGAAPAPWIPPDPSRWGAYADSQYSDFLGGSGAGFHLALLFYCVTGRSGASAWFLSGTLWFGTYPAVTQRAIVDTDRYTNYVYTTFTSCNPPNIAPGWKRGDGPGFVGNLTQLSPVIGP